MERLLSLYLQLKNREEGQTMVEYSLILALMVAVIALVFTQTGLGDAIEGAIDDVIAVFP
jgi:Flp pilus assembly pilin Flp